MEILDNQVMRSSVICLAEVFCAEHSTVRCALVKCPLCKVQKLDQVMVGGSFLKSPTLPRIQVLVNYWKYKVPYDAIKAF